MRDLHVSWDEYNRQIEKLAVRIHDSDWHFDAIVCLARGGLRVGDALSRLFRRPRAPGAWPRRLGCGQCHVERRQHLAP